MERAPKPPSMSTTPQTTSTTQKNVAVSSKDSAKEWIPGPTSSLTDAATTSRVRRTSSGLRPAQRSKATTKDDLPEVFELNSDEDTLDDAEMVEIQAEENHAER